MSELGLPGSEGTYPALAFATAFPVWNEESVHSTSPQGKFCTTTILFVTLKLSGVLSFVYLKTAQIFMANTLSKEIITFTGQLLLFLVTALCKAQDIKLWDLHLPNTTLLVNKSDEVSKETFKTVYSPFLQSSWTDLRKSRKRRIGACWNSSCWQKSAIAAQFMS